MSATCTSNYQLQSVSNQQQDRSSLDVARPRRPGVVRTGYVTGVEVVKVPTCTAVVYSPQGLKSGAYPKDK